MPGSYAARQPPAKEGEKPVTVLVTGFGVSKRSKRNISLCPSIWAFDDDSVSYPIYEIVH
jgi:hypothetical protein